MRGRINFKLKPLALQAEHIGFEADEVDVFLAKSYS